MGISLNGLTPAGTYPGLIKTGDNTAISGTPKVLSDGNGNNLPMEVSTTGVNFTNNLTQGGTALQPVLVSGTNIKTINGASLLGSGNIPVVTSPSGVSGAIQFSNGSAFASDAANFFWDDTNNRLGIGTNAPTSALDLRGSLNIRRDSTNFTMRLGNLGQDNCFIDASNTNTFYLVDATFSNSFSLSNVGIGLGVSPIASTRVAIKGSGSTSATTALLVQNSAGAAAFQIKDDTFVSFPSTANNYQVMIGGQTGTNKNGLSIGYTISGTVFSQGGIFGNPNTATNELYGITNSILSFKDGEILIKNANNGAAISNPSAILTIDSTTKGVLFPRMTTTQKNAIASPASGLILYDSTTNKLQCYNGSTWNDLF
jgi:hypothetical protein